MLKEHKNAFLVAIEQYGLSLQHFHARDIKQEWYKAHSIRDDFEITVRGSVYTSPPDFKVSFSWDSLAIRDNLNVTLVRFNNWLGDVSRLIQELSIPDLWSQVLSYHPLQGISTISSEDTSHFSENEK